MASDVIIRSLLLTLFIGVLVPACSGSGSVAEKCVDVDNDGYQHGSFCQPNDCNDRDPLVNPGRSETVYDGVDNDCNPSTLDDDLDSDGYPSRLDCDDQDASLHPGARETCGDDIDQNCDGRDMPCGCVDSDSDGFHNAACGGSDCNDSDNGVHPEATEVCGDKIDQDCDGFDLPCDCPDADGDGYLDVACGGRDCDDTDPLIRPGAIEVCEDDLDQDCNGDDLECWCTDSDADGHYEDDCGGDDCNDHDATIHPAFREDCDGKDNDCDGITDEGLGTAPCDLTLGVCANAFRECWGMDGWDECEYGRDYEFMEGSCDGLDNDCDGQTDGLDTDVLVPLCGMQRGVCNGATNSLAHCGENGWLPCGPGEYGPDYEPDEVTLTDGLDNDCDGETDETVVCDPPCELAEICEDPEGDGSWMCNLAYTADTPYCQPCDDASQVCGAAENRCLIYTSGPDEFSTAYDTYCGVACSDDQPCPTGFHCTEYTVLTESCGTGAACGGSCTADVPCHVPDGERCGTCPCHDTLAPCPENACVSGTCMATGRSCDDEHPCPPIECVEYPGQEYGYCREGQYCTLTYGYHCPLPPWPE